MNNAPKGNNENYPEHLLKCLDFSHKGTRGEAPSSMDKIYEGCNIKHEITQSEHTSGGHEEGHGEELIRGKVCAFMCIM